MLINFVKPVLENIKGPNDCVILVPCLSGIEYQTEESLKILENKGYTVWRQPGWSAIDQGRNKMVYDAVYKHGFKEVFFIDSDIEFMADDVDRLRNYNVPLIGSTYVLKGNTSFYTYIPLDNKNIIFNGTEPIEIKYIATGFLYIQSEVFRVIEDKMKLPICDIGMINEQIPFFQPMVVTYENKNYYIGEDYSFCERARICGIRVMLDLVKTVGHIGKFTYYGK